MAGLKNRVVTGSGVHGRCVFTIVYGLAFKVYFFHRLNFYEIIIKIGSHGSDIR